MGDGERHTCTRYDQGSEEAERIPEMPTAQVIDILNTVYDRSYNVEAARTRKAVHKEIRAHQEKEQKLKNERRSTDDCPGEGPEPSRCREPDYQVLDSVEAGTDVNGSVL